MSSQITEIALSFTQLQPKESVLCSGLLQHLKPVKALTFFGPVVYNPSLTIPICYGHLTEKRLIIETLTDGNGVQGHLANVAILAITAAMDPGLAVNLGYDYAKEKMDQEVTDLRTMSIFHSEIASIEMIKTVVFAKHIKISKRGAKDLIFNVFPARAVRNVQDFIQNLYNIQGNLSFVNEFYELYQSLIKSS